MNKTDVKELIELVTGEEIEETTTDVANSVIDFIQTFSIKAGQTRVPSYKFFYDYISWDRYKSTKLSKVEFCRQMAKLFDNGRGNKGRYFLLDESSFDLSEKSLNRAKSYDREYQSNFKIQKRRKRQEYNRRAKKE